MKGTMFVRNGAVTPGPSRECDITFFAKGHRKIKGRFRKRAVLANVLSFRFLGSRII